MIYTKELFSFILGKEDFGDESEEEEKIIIKQKGSTLTSRQTVIFLIEPRKLVSR
jgi:hypothetical protein